MKTIMQLNKKYAKMGLVNVFKHIYNKNGFFGIYRGYTSLLIFSVPNVTVNFAAF